jgi:hypothetical protein
MIMKILTFLILLSPLFLEAQIVIDLNVNQPPEFGFEVSNKDTTIINGSSIVLGNDIVVFGGSGEYQYSWSPAGTLDDSTLIYPFATPTDTTNYILTVFDNNGCSFSIDYKVNVREVGVNVTDIDIEESQLKIILYPNPNNGLFKVHLKGLPEDEIQIKVMDKLGRYIHHKMIRNFTGEQTETLQLKLSSGTYFLEVIAKDSRLQRQFIIH